MKFELNWPKDLGGVSIESKLCFSIFSPGGYFAHWSETILAILVEATFHLVEATFLYSLYGTGLRVKEEFAFKDFSIFSSSAHFVYRSKIILAILVGSHLGNTPVKFELHWPKGSGGVSF